MHEHSTSMTSGRPFGLLIRFALPLIIGSVFQQLYTITDAAIIGRGVGPQALAAVGAGDWILWMVVGAIQAMMQGFSIETATAYGQENEKRLVSAIWHSVVLAAVISAVMTAVSLLLMKPALNLLNTPADIMDGALTYLGILYTGCVIITAYQLAAALLRSFGDSRTPLYAMTAASLINIGLDLLFVYRFHMGIGGAAWATVIAQGAAALICIAKLRNQISLPLRMEFRMETAVRLVRLGLPLAFQVVIIAAGGLALQNAVNQYGSVFVAGYTAANKMFGILESAGIAFGYGAASYTAQNLGAGKTERIPEGVRAGLLFSVLVSGFISVCMLVFGRSIMSLFVERSAQNYDMIIDTAYQYLSVMSYALLMLYMLHLYKSMLQGLGLTVQSMISGIVELAARIILVFTLPGLIGSAGIFIAEIGAWIGAALYLMLTYYRLSPGIIKSVDIQKNGE
ncbi:MAG: MATE family efflux transporter [Solobacterium sp.]|nr:MATE family efflux transporter [Solobacterium sp.]